jgi:hypothetical protein
VLTNKFLFSALCSTVAVLGLSLPAAAQGASPEPEADAEIGADSVRPANPAPVAPPAASASASASTSTPDAPVAAPPAPPPHEGATAGSPAATPTPASAAAAPPEKKPDPLVEITGYAQVEYQSHADSEDQLLQGSNTTLNQNRFLIRRARLTAKRAWEYTSLELELDGNTVSGPSFGLYRAEASVYYRPDKEKPPFVQLTLGQFRLPFGAELVELPAQRWFTERTLLSRALFPTEIDLGGRLSGGYGPFRYALAFTNGEPLGEKNGFQLQDPNKSKDFTLNVGAVGNPLEKLRVSGGVSALKGKGFHPGTSASKPSAVWNDQNDDGLIQPNELQPNPARAAVPSESFERWAIGGDLRIELTTPIGVSTLYGEVVAAQNLDRGYFPADPVSAGQDLREFGYFVGFLQEITPYAVVGFRYEFYDPNADSTDRRAGKTLPAENSVKTFSPLVGVTLPKRARLLFQYDIIKDYLARDTSGVPSDLKNNAWTLRLQVSL